MPADDTNESGDHAVAATTTGHGDFPIVAPATDTWISATAAPPPPPGAGPHDAAPAPRRRRGLLIAVVVAVLVVAGGAIGAGFALSSSSSSSSTPAVVGGPAAATRLVQSSLAAAVAAKTFHYVSTSTTSGVTQMTVGDAAPDRGQQVITIGSHSFTVIVVGTAAYFQGDAVTLQSELNLDPLVAQQHAGQWISLAPTDTPYQSVYAAVTTQSALDDTITIAGKAVLENTTIGRTTVTPVRGILTPVAQTPTTGAARLDVRTSRSHLPVRFTGSGAVNGQQTTLSVTFGNWGEPVTVTAPSEALAYSSIQIGGLNPGSGGVVLT